MIETVIVRPLEHNITVRPFINDQSQTVERQRVVVRQGVQVVQVGVQGPPGRNGLMADFEQTFTDCTECVINHNLGRYPIISIFSLGGAAMDALPVNTSLNQVHSLFQRADFREYTLHIGDRHASKRTKS